MKYNDGRFKKAPPIKLGLLRVEVDTLGNKIKIYEGLDRWVYKKMKQMARRVEAGKRVW